LEIQPEKLEKEKKSGSQNLSNYLYRLAKKQIIGLL